MQKVTVIFKFEPRSIRGFLVLYGMFTRGSVRITNDSRALAIAMDIGETHSWGDPEDCRFVVELGCGMTIEQLREALQTFYESIEPVAPPNPLAGLTVRRELMRVVNATKLERACLPSDLQAEMRGWGIQFCTDFTAPPRLEITLLGLPGPENRVVLNGATGQIEVADKRYPYESPQQVQTIMRGMVNGYLDG